MWTLLIAFTIDPLIEAPKAMEAFIRSYQKFLLSIIINLCFEMTINKPLILQEVNQINLNLTPWGYPKAGSNLSHSESSRRCSVVLRTFGELPSAISH